MYVTFATDRLPTSFLISKVRKGTLRIDRYIFKFHNFTFIKQKRKTNIHTNINTRKTIAEWTVKKR